MIEDTLARSLQDEILDLKGKIAERLDLSRRILLKFERMISKVNSVILNLPGGAPLRSSLEKEKTALERAKLQEEVACWRDVSALEAELRQVAKGKQLMEDVG